jgi:topoisomerase-4 subunit B
LHGVGASVVNALSSEMMVKVMREGKIYESKYHDGGKILQKSTPIGPTNKTGTCV